VRIVGAKRRLSARSTRWIGTTVSWAAFALYFVVLKVTTFTPVRIVAVVILGFPIVFVNVGRVRALFRTGTSAAEEERKRNPKLR
jgi:hypothetical protein